MLYALDPEVQRERSSHPLFPAAIQPPHSLTHQEGRAQVRFDSTTRTIIDGRHGRRHARG
jgi:hypothetical protein